MDLGLERAGMECRWQVENNEFCQKVLAKHWPAVQRWADVRTFPPRSGCLTNDWSVDLICGGFPCQDLSSANPQKTKGLDGKQSGLWNEFYRIIRALRPRHVLIENTPTLRFRGLDRILCELAGIGYDAEWSIVSACSLGAAHMRRRLFIHAYTDGFGLDGRLKERSSKGKSMDIRQILLDSTDGLYLCGTPGLRSRNGIPDYVDRIRGLGNSVVPQVAELIGRRVIDLWREKEGIA